MRIEKYEFTYDDYLNYCDSLYCHKQEDFLCVREEEILYNFDEDMDKKTRDKKHDKIFKEILQKPNEMAQFISNFTKHRVKADELEILYTGNAKWKASNSFAMSQIYREGKNWCRI